MDMNKLNLTFCLTLLLAFQGCMSEDLSNCYPTYNIDIKFDYHGDDSIVSLFDKQINNVDTYIFSKDGKLVKHIAHDKAELNNYEGLRDILTNGHYSFISFANIKNLTHVSDSNNFAQARVQAHHLTRSLAVPRSIDHIYSCLTDVEVKPTGITQKKGEFRSAHMNIALYVKNVTLSATTPDSLLPIIRVNHLPEQMNFSLGLEPQTISYHPTLQYDATKKLFASYFQTFRFTPQHPIDITIENATGELLQTVDLQSFISNNKLHAIYSKQEETIEVLIEILATGIIISIPNWGSEDLTPN